MYDNKLELVKSLIGIVIIFLGPYFFGLTKKRRRIPNGSSFSSYHIQALI